MKNLFQSIKDSLFAIDRSTHYEKLGGKMYKGGELYTGEIRYKKNGYLDSVERYQKGIAEGVWEKYFDGKLDSLTPYVNGKVHGLAKIFYSKNKNICSTQEFIEGKEHGVGIDYDQNGLVKREKLYKEGMPRGIWDVYYKNSSQCFSKQIYADEGYTSDYVYKAQFFYKSGKLMAEGSRGHAAYDHPDPHLKGQSGNHGLWNYYHKNGKLSASVTYNGGWRDGPVEAFDENGILRIKGQYSRYKQVFYKDRGIEVGLWEYFDESGKKCAEKEYKVIKEGFESKCIRKEGQFTEKHLLSRYYIIDLLSLRLSEG